MKLWKQTTKYSCGPSVLMMILNHYKKCSMSKKEEIKLWKETRINPLKLESEFAIALAMAKRGITTEIITTSKIPNKTEIDFCLKYEKIPKNKLKCIFSEYKENKLKMENLCKKSGIKIIKKVPNIKDLTHSFKKGPAIIIFDDFSLDRNSHCIHAASVLDRKDKFFTLYDPWYGKIKMSESEMNKSFRSLKSSLKMNPAIISIVKVDQYGH